MTAGADKTKPARVEYLDRDQIKALRERESEARKHRAREESQRGDRIMSALDKLGQRLVESESERQTLKDLIDQAKSHQKELQSQIEDSQKKQRVVEDDLHSVKQQNLRLHRKLEQQDQARARLNRRMQRLEMMAQEAQTALDSKAMVLLTDQTLARQSALPQARAGEALPLAIDHHAAKQAEIAAMPWWKRPMKMSTGAMLMTGAAVLALGLLVANAFDRGDSAFAVMQDGSLARIDLRTGTVQPMRIQAEEVRTPGGRLFALTRSQRRDEGRLSYDPEGIPAQAARGRMAALDLMDIPDVTAQIDPDVSLRGNIKALEDQALAGNAEAQHDLAALYTAGQGVTQDYQRAVALFRLSANQGVANAAYNLGVLYQQGLGVQQNMPLALDWYRRAALSGHPEAEYNLGIAYIEGIGTAFNPQLAAVMFQQAAMKGIMEAAYNLGLILENVLVEGSQTRDALIWYRAAMEGGSEEARGALTALAQKLGVPFETAGRVGDEPFSAFVAQARQDRDFEWPDAYQMVDVLPDTQTMIMIKLQQQMTRLGNYTGVIDGQESEALRQAISDYKDANGVADQDLTFVEFLSLLLTLRTGA